MNQIITKKNGLEFNQEKLYLYFTPAIRVIIILSCALATFMDILDTTIVNVAIHTITGDLGVSTSEGIWIITSYTVALAISTPISGYLSRHFGMIKLFLLSTAFFTIFSFLDGISSNIETLVLFRTLQGLSAGPLTPCALAIMNSVVDPKDRTKVVILFSMTVLIAPSTGPWLGGWITDNFNWSLLFFINIPTGILIISIISSLMYKYNTYKKEKLDILGFIFLVLCVGSLQVLLDKGEQWNWFESATSIILLINSIVFFIILIWWELRVESPLLDLYLFKKNIFIVINILFSFGFALHFSTVVLNPMILQGFLGYNAYWAGYASAFLGLGGIIAVPFMANAMRKGIDGRKLLVLSWVIFGTCSIWRARFFVGIENFNIFFPYLIQGLGIAFFFPILMNILGKNFKGTELIAATGISTFLRNTFGSFGVSITNTYFSHRIELHSSRLSEHIHQYSNNFQNFYNKLKHAIDESQIIALTNIMIHKQAGLMAANDLLFLFGLLFLSLIPLAFLMKHQDLSNSIK